MIKTSALYGIRNRVLWLLPFIAQTLLADQPPPATMTPEDIEIHQKLRHVAAVPFKFISDFGAPNGELMMLQIRPTYTISTENYNFINRPIIPYLELNGEVGGRPDLPNALNPDF